MAISRQNIKRFLLYGARWETSTLVLAPCIALFGFMGEWPATIIANAIGAVIFFWVDKLIFKEEK